ncbi:protein GPR15LG [Panthera pardus]|uniref:G protein-coupled receptor 15 ligand n=2 Tax=Panthera TaxID=9688 RepID=A0A8C8X290_PANLE|nr:protein GPR15LG [Panthera pardus]XP_042764400.1 protein GPR15L [Panthera leo]XP_049501276.1 protein GPR15LG [Panthera uncia]XP_058552857.1 protein GPR15LG [Neofelis nebulosa]XP_060498298.1 protein GPR15LG [Panthera onca]
MRFLVLSRLLCILLLCFSIFSVEGRRHSRHLAKPRKGKLCCSRVPSPVPTAQKGRHVRICRQCKVKPGSRTWVVPGALPQV